MILEWKVLGEHFLYSTCFPVFTAFLLYRYGGLCYNARYCFGGNSSLGGTRTTYSSSVNVDRVNCLTS